MPGCALICLQAHATLLQASHFPCPQDQNKEIKGCDRKRSTHAMAIVVADGAAPGGGILFAVESRNSAVCTVVVIVPSPLVGYGIHTFCLMKSRGCPCC